MKHKGDDPYRREGDRLPARRSQVPAARGGGETFVMVPQEMAWGEPPQKELDLLSYWRMLLNRRWTILASLATALALGGLLIFLTTPEYQATTSIQIEREAAKIVDVEGVEAAESPAGDREFYETQYELLKSRSLAERVAQSLNLANDTDFLTAQAGAGPVENLRSRFGDAPQPPRDPVARERAAVAQLMNGLDVEPVRNSRLVQVSFTGADPELSAKVANAVADAFIESTLRRRFDASAYAREFLEKRLKEVKQRLEDSERQLVSYAQSQGIVNVPSGEGAGGGRSIDSSSLVSLNDSLSAAKAERIRAEAQWRQAQSAGALTLPAVLQSSSINVMREARARLTAEYQQKLSTFQPAYPDMVQLRAQIDELDRQIAAEVSNVKTSVRNNYEAARRQEAALEAQVSGLKSGVLNLQGRSIQYTILQREVDTNRELYDGLLQRYKQIGVAGAVGTNNISIVDRAEVPGSPATPNKPLILAVAALIGLLAGLLLAFVLEHLDETISTPDDIEHKLGLALVGAIPALARGQTVMHALRDQRSPFSEAYYSAGTALSFARDDGLPKAMLITSTRQGEGKSTTAQTLAVNFAQLGRRVLLIDADLRNPTLHKMLRIDNHMGLSNVLRDGKKLSDVATRIGPTSLFVAACGPLPSNPAALLGGERLRAAIQEAMEEYDLVLIDGPPVLGLADANLLGAVVEGVVLVVEAGSTKLGAARAALRRLQFGRAEVLGALLTKYNAKKAGYGYAYGEDSRYSYGAGQKKLSPAGALAVGGLVAWLGWTLVSTNMADRAAAEDPARALGWRPDHAGALLASAVDHLQAESPDTLDGAERSARAALRGAPLSTPALSVLGLVAEARGQNARAEALIGLAAKRGPRDRAAHVWLFERAVAEGRPDRAWFHADVLLRADEAIYEELLPHLMRLAASEDAAAPLASRLALSPRWRGRFLQEVSEQAEDPLVLRPIFQALQTGPAPPSDDELGRWLRRLVDRERYAEAHGAWLAVSPEARTGGAPHNGGFEPGPQGSPFTWSLGRGGGGEAVIAPAGDGRRGYALRAAPRQEARAPWISQLLVLAPGTYVLSLDSRSEDAGAAPMRWRLRCVGDNAELGGVGPLPGRTHWGVSSAAFTVPVGCPAQELALVPAPVPVTQPESLAPVWFDDLRISPAPPPGRPEARGRPQASS